uniref:Uncharacterized protein n=1 Tax=Arundo donax TaxID=35708 RepID=A0A0A8YJL3_ARUDO
MNSLDNLCSTVQNGVCPHIFLFLLGIAENYPCILSHSLTILFFSL